ncbi:MAG: nucleotidyltransferase domain-containing protein [Nanoarchaeota archaeon]
MNASSVLKMADFSPSKEDLEYIKKEAKVFVEHLKECVAKKGIEAEVFVGGSFAKGTLTKSDKYDVDIFVRFDWKYELLSEELEKILKILPEKYLRSLQKVHGSRDYFRININEKTVFEVIPVTKINKPKEARNVTDLSYFHVNYVRKNLEEKNEKDVRLAKYFCTAQGVYGAESYINGFSGYAIECLVIYYKSFLKMLRELSKADEKIIIDLKKYYKNKEDVLFDMNESRLNSPIVLVDPTFKERNVLAALNVESFKRFQRSAKDFLDEPSDKFFMEKKNSKDYFLKIAKKKNAEFLNIIIETDRQEGDIAGTKMKKFSRFLESAISKFFTILERDFSYNKGKASNFFIVAKSKKSVIKAGPPISLKSEVRSFKLKNKEVFEKNKSLYAKITIDFSLEDFVNKLNKKESKKLKEMGITVLKLIK